MKVGDLVTLSSYGKNRKCNGCISGYGIISDISNDFNDRYPIEVHWFDGEETATYYFSRNELKYYKPDKI